MTVSRNPVEDRCVGALIGLAVGDAIGTTLEFRSRDTYRHLTDMVGGGPFGLKPGQWTDDTSMALCLAESLLTYGDLDAIDCTDRWIRWRDKGDNSSTGSCFDIGGQTSAALSYWQQKGEAPPSSESAGNGGIMRLAPAVIRHWQDEAKAVAVAVAQSNVTHNNAQCEYAAACLARVLYSAINGDGEGVLKLVPISVKQLKRDEIKSSGYVKHTLDAALWCLAFGDGFEKIVLRAANLGDDADTVAAVAGQMAGAMYGLSGIPARWGEGAGVERPDHRARTPAVRGRTCP